MIKLMVMEFIYILMEHDMKGNGKMIYNMGMEKKYGPIILLMRVITMKVKSKEKEDMFGRMEVFMMEIGLIIELKEMENIHG